jgi:predicted Zn-dependent protease
VKVPPDVALTYEAAREAWDADDFGGALALLDAHAGTEHALLLLLRGRILHDSGEYAGAVDAYTRCLAADNTRRDAGLGLINALVSLERYGDALPHCGRWIDQGTATASELHLYAVVASRAGDRDLAWQLAERGRVRFPTHDGLRHVLLSVLVDIEAYRDAALCLADLLEREPGNPKLWRYLAMLRQRTADDDGAAGRVALEAALLCNADDVQLRESLMRSQLSVRQVHAALANAKRLMDGARPSGASVALAVHCALEADDAKQARTWLDAVPAAERTHDLRRLAVRVALAEGDAATARENIGLLLEAGDEDDRLLVQAGALDEGLGRTASAEALYRTCIQGGGPSAGSARLYLARLLLSVRRLDEAAEQVGAYLAVRPADQQAERMMRIITTMRRAAPQAP